MMNTKICTRCGLVKPLAEFYRQSDKADGRTSACKACTQISHDAYNQTEKGKTAIAKALHNYHQSDKFKTVQRRYRATDKGKISHRGTVDRFGKTPAGRLRARRNADRTRLLYRERVNARK